MLMMLASGAQADIYKCQTPNGLKYEDKPCPEGSALGSLEAHPAPARPQPQAAQSKTPAQKPQANVNDVNAVPLLFPQNQQRVYQEFLARPSPRAFGICKDGGTITIVGNADFVKREMNDVEHGVKYGCRIYAVNDEVVW